MKKATAHEKSKSNAYESRENWPPYTYRDYPDIKPETYKSFLKFLKHREHIRQTDGAATVDIRLRLKMRLLLFPNRANKQGADRTLS